MASDDKEAPGLYHATMFLFFSNRKGCLGSLLISIAGSLLLMVLLRSCNGGF